MYFTQVLNNILTQIKISIKGWHVGETRGNADFAIHFQSEGEFNFDISFQAGTFKFAVSRLYWTDQSKANIDKVLEWEDDFKELQKEHPEYKRLNRAKSRARISISKNIKIEQKEWYLMDNTAFTKAVQKEFEQAELMRQQVISIHKNRKVL